MSLSEQQLPERLPIRIWISYAHSDQSHKNNVRKLGRLLKQIGFDVRLDVFVADEPQDWSDWIVREVRSADFVLIMTSPEYKRRAEGSAPEHEGRGVQFEASLIRREFYANQAIARRKFLAVVLPDTTVEDIPLWLGGPATTYYELASITPKSARKLLQYLHRQSLSTHDAPQGSAARPKDFAAPSYSRLGSANSAKRIAFATDEVSLQAQIRQVLVAGGIGLSDEDLGVDIEEQDAGRRLIDIRRARTVIEVASDLDEPHGWRNAEQVLASYASRKVRHLGDVYTGVLTNGRQWQAYEATEEGIEPVASWATEQNRPDLRGLLSWLEAILSDVS